MVYYSLFYPHIQYCIPAWGGASGCHLKPILFMKNRIGRYVCRVPTLTPNKSIVYKNYFSEIELGVGFEHL